MMKRKKGFTLTEVVIVVVILAVLASIVVPRFFGQDERGIIAEAIGMLSAIRQSEAGYRLENPGYLDMDTTVAADDAKWAEIGIDKPSTGKFNYAVASGTATATRSATAGDDFKNKTIILKMDGTWDSAATHPFKPK